MNKNNVYEAYEKITDWYDLNRAEIPLETQFLNFIITCIPKSASILDIGCGTGNPIAKFFIEKGYKVTGIDGSQKMIALCEKRFPDQRWIEVDMRKLDLNEQFDLLIAWNSFFHLPHEDQRAMFKIFESHVKPNGILAFTTGSKHGEVWSENGGEKIYHASLSQEEYEELLIKHAFRKIIHTIKDPKSSDPCVWIAKKQAEF